MNHRYQTIEAVKFPTKDELVPFWECEFDKYQDDAFYSNELEETSSFVVETIWDCKKKIIPPSFYVSQYKESLPIGTKVVVTDGTKARLEVIKEVKFENYEDYFSKYKDEKNSIRLKGLTIPENTKVIVYRHHSPTYTFESGNSCPHEVYIKELVEN